MSSKKVPVVNGYAQLITRMGMNCYCTKMPNTSFERDAPPKSRRRAPHRGRYTRLGVERACAKLLL